MSMAALPIPNPFYMNVFLLGLYAIKAIIAAYSPLAYNIIFLKLEHTPILSVKCEFHTNDLFARLEQVPNNHVVLLTQECNCDK